MGCGSTKAWSETTRNSMGLSSVQGGSDGQDEAGLPCCRNIVDVEFPQMSCIQGSDGSSWDVIVSDTFSYKYSEDRAFDSNAELDLISSSPD